MKVTLSPRTLSGTVPAIGSKSHIHRLLICAALGDHTVFLPCRAPSEDILATARCLSALGAGIEQMDDGFTVSPVGSAPAHGAADCGVADCGESGSTYRFLAPVACALGQSVRFSLSGRLPERPMDALWSALEAHGGSIAQKGSSSPLISGPLEPGAYEIPGNVSSQFVSGLLLALPLLSGDSRLTVSGSLASAGYVRMTLDALAQFSIRVLREPDGFFIPGGQRFRTPMTLLPEGDWSSAAVWLCAGACGGSGVTVTGLNTKSSQGDKAVCELLRRFGAEVDVRPGRVTVRPALLRGIELDADGIPDLIPALALPAAAASGETVIRGAGRLRLKESDRLAAISSVLTSLGGSAEIDGDSLVIRGGGLRGGMADGFGDHRIVMLAAAASALCRDPVTVTGTEAVRKSYPGFFEDLTALGGLLTESEET